MSFYDKVRRQKFLSFSLILFTLAIGVLIGTLAQTGARAAKLLQAAAPDATPLTIPSAVQVQNEFSKIAKRLEPSVVNISTEYIPKATTTENRPQSRRRLQQQQQEPDDQGDDSNPMEQLFRRFMGQGGGGMDVEPDDSLQRGARLRGGSG